MTVLKQSSRYTYEYDEVLTLSGRCTHEYTETLHRDAGVLRSTLRCYKERQVYSRVCEGVKQSGRCTHEYMKVLHRTASVLTST